MKFVIPITVGFMLGMIAGLEWKRLQLESEMIYAVKNCQRSVDWVYQNNNEQLRKLEVRLRAMENVQQQERWK